MRGMENEWKEDEKKKKGRGMKKSKFLKRIEVVSVLVNDEEKNVKVIKDWKKDKSDVGRLEIEIGIVGIVKGEEKRVEIVENEIEEIGEKGKKGVELKIRMEKKGEEKSVGR